MVYVNINNLYKIKDTKGKGASINMDKDTVKNRLYVDATPTETKYDEKKDRNLARLKEQFEKISLMKPQKKKPEYIYFDI